MMDYMLYKAKGASYEDLVKNPKVAKNISKQDIEKDDMNKAPFFDTWGSKTGRCTSFAVKITAELVKANPGVFDFKVYDLKGHRVARCIKTGVLIDSSSWVGAFILKEGEWKTFQDGATTAKWKWVNNESKFKTDGKEKSSSTVITSREAMAICLTEVAERPIVLTLFRSFSNEKTGYHGMFSWVFNKKRLEMTPDLEKRKSKLVITWDGKGTEEDNKACVDNFAQFVMNYGGPHWEQQFKATGIMQVNEKIWNAANIVWGAYPKYSVEGTELPIRDVERAVELEEPLNDQPTQQEQEILPVPPPPQQPYDSVEALYNDLQQFQRENGAAIVRSSSNKKYTINGREVNT
ncbi:hypothetical protein HRG_000668 [Hirsutella rhossiliensis]|uniref:Uncharacterized protein n=1 Tax=Hirsutella rhossiliensis TaxID=111463 RepID=A0A9P8SMH9_9HYPO|nr:uncharacterized protein HRG_00668 [Hirsutella rhossiliensis]KAH0968026.1 hypothetical protein HRG_00668 [Hirsutella rhossiliensis]